MALFSYSSYARSYAWSLHSSSSYLVTELIVSKEGPLFLSLGEGILLLPCLLVEYGVFSFPFRRLLSPKASQRPR